jgi:predicted molibdopterin-dependent oxidoreductase YjgC
VATATFCDAASVLEELELVVVQHLFMTDTAEHAHVILPSTAFGEEQVTFTSTDRRVQLAAQAIPAPAGTKPAWQQLMLVARALGADWRYLSAADVMAEIGRLIPAYSGIAYPTLGNGFGRQWPCTPDRPLGTKFLFGDDSPARPFRPAAVTKPGPPACASKDFPFGLVFGQSLYYWHHNTLIRHSETLKREYRLLLLDYPEGFVDVNEADAKALGVRDGGRIRLVTPEGATETVARVTREVRAGTVFVPFFVREVERQILGRMTVEVGALDRPVCVRIEKG